MSNLSQDASFLKNSSVQLDKQTNIYVSVERPIHFNNLSVFTCELDTTPYNLPYAIRQYGGIVFQDTNHMSNTHIFVPSRENLKKIYISS